MNILHYSQKGIKVADGIKDANPLALNLGDYPDGPNVIIRVLKCGRVGELCEKIPCQSDGVGRIV